MVIKSAGHARHSRCRVDGIPTCPIGWFNTQVAVQEKVAKGEVAVAYQVQDAEGTGKELVKIGEKKGERGDERHHKSCWREG